MLLPPLRGTVRYGDDRDRRDRGRRLRRWVIEVGGQPRAVPDPRQRGNRIRAPAPSGALQDRRHVGEAVSAARQQAILGRALIDVTERQLAEMKPCDGWPAMSRTQPWDHLRRSRARPESGSPLRSLNDQKGDIVPERSPEIEQVLRDTLDAMVRSDLDGLGRRTSRDACVLSIGSDASEWAEGYDDIMQLFSESSPEGELGVRVGLDNVTAFREGTVGWAAGHGYFEVEGKRVPVRLTAVLHEEDGEWKAVQSHASIGVPNEQMLDPMFQITG